MNAPMVIEQKQVQTLPGDLLRIAVEHNMPLETLQRLMDLQDRWEEKQARKAFANAMAQFRDKQIKVLRSATVEQGPMRGITYAKLNDFVAASSEALSSVGLSASWRIVKQEKDWMEVACIIRHRDGHQEEVSMGGPIDTSGAKNPIQSRASTLTYLEKYTLKMALGLSEADDDDDGNGHGDQSRKRTEPDFYPVGKFKENLPKWQKLIEAGKKTATDIIATVESSGAKLTPEQKLEIESIKEPQQ